MTTRKRLTAVIDGVVQGVGFRAFVRHEARRLGLTGYARNCPDGSVEVVAEGPERELQALERLLRRGPASAVVTRFDAQWSDAAAERPPVPRTFEIR